jgi:error-prone DNA polymerase
VIARQRPGTASRFIFFDLEDETGMSNAIINAHLYERDRLAVTRWKLFWVEGPLHNQISIVNGKPTFIVAANLSLGVR